MLSKLKIFCIFLLGVFGINLLHADYPIYIMLTHPRATGTAFEKVMRTIDQLQVLHAPYFDPHLIRKYGPNHPFVLSLPNQTLTFDDATKKIFALAKQGPVFFKESGYVLTNYFKEHPEFYKNPLIKIAFLIRDPAKSILSFYRKMPTVDESIVGHRQLWELFNLLRDQLHAEPLVIDSDEFLKNPLPILNKLGKHWDLMFKEKNLHWDTGYADDWHLKDWYVEVGASTQLGPHKGDVERDADGIPKYLEVANEVDRTRLQELYRIQNVYYKKLLEHSLKAE